MSWFVRKNRLLIHKYMYKDYDDNPLNVNPEKFNTRIYQDLAQKARSEIDYRFIRTIENEFGYLIDDEFIHDLALSTQITIKSSKPLYLHGYLLYGAVRKYLKDNAGLENLILLETGTACGFSALVMAKALNDARRMGKIITIDILPFNRAIYWNCVHDHAGRRTRLQLLNKWQTLIYQYILFIQGYSDIVLSQMALSRINVAFLDGGHDYTTVKYELKYIRSRQSTGDVIICDDYTKILYPGLVKAVSEVLLQNEYLCKTYQGSENRIYLYCKRK